LSPVKEPEVPVIKKSLGVESNSSSSSADDSSSETDPDQKESEDSEDDKDARNIQFGLGQILQTTKTTSPSSERSVRPTPSPRYPTPSPRYLAHPSPSPGKPALPSPGVPYKLDGTKDSPGLMSMGIPSLLAPLSPGDLLSPLEEIDVVDKEDKPSIKMEGNDVKNVQPPNISTDDDETQFDPKPRIKPKSKKPSKSRTSGSSGADRRKSSKNFTSQEFLPQDTDSDSDHPPPTKQSKARAFSASPLKRPQRSPNKMPSSTHSTPVRGPPPTSSQSTPVHERSSKSKKSKSHSVHSSPGRSSSSRRQVSPTLSVSDSDDESPAPIKPAPTKSSILSKMFLGGAAKGGGKGKGKGKGKKGGITVQIVERIVKIANLSQK